MSYPTIYVTPGLPRGGGGEGCFTRPHRFKNWPDQSMPNQNLNVAPAR
jgi:hypothetical protein